MNEEDYSGVFDKTALPGGDVKLLEGLDADHERHTGVANAYSNAPKRPESAYLYDEETGMMRFPGAEDERLIWKSFTLDELSRATAAVRYKHNVPRSYRAFVKAGAYDWDASEFGLEVWFGRPETGKEEKTRVEYEEAKERYWNERSVAGNCTPSKYFWVKDK